MWQMWKKKHVAIQLCITVLLCVSVRLSSTSTTKCWYWSLSTAVLYLVFPVFSHQYEKSFFNFTFKNVFFLLWNQYSLLFIHMNTVKDVDVLVCFLLYCNEFVNQGPQSYCKEGCCVQLLPPSVRGSHRSWCWWSQSVCWVFIEQ